MRFAGILDPLREAHRDPSGPKHIFLPTVLGVEALSDVGRAVPIFTLYIVTNIMYDSYRSTARILIAKEAQRRSLRTLTQARRLLGG